MCVTHMQMNEDIAYSVLSFLHNPKQYQSVSTSFRMGAQYAQEEFVQYVRSQYPLLLSSATSLCDRLYGNKQYDYYIRMIQKSLQSVYVFYLNKMALDGDWEMFEAIIPLIDATVLCTLPNTIVHLCHINGNDALALRLHNYFSDGIFPDHVIKYYEFDQDNVHNFTASSFSLGYIPQAVIDYCDKHGMNEEQMRRGTLPALINRKVSVTSSYVYVSHVPGISTNQMHEICEIARDHPHENAYELLTRRYPDDVDGKVTKILLDRVRCYNSRLLQYVGKALTAMGTIMGCTIPLIVIAHLATQKKHISMVQEYIEQELSTFKDDVFERNIDNIIVLHMLQCKIQGQMITEDEIYTLLKTYVH